MRFGVSRAGRKKLQQQTKTSLHRLAERQKKQREKKNIFVFNTVLAPGGWNANPCHRQAVVVGRYNYSLSVLNITYLTENDENTLADKRAELIAHVTTELSDYSNIDKVAELVVDNLCEINEPDIEVDVNTDYTLSVLNQGDGLTGGFSIKPGNIVISWKRLLFDSFEHTLTLIGAVTTSILAPVVIPFAALVVYNKISGLKKIKIEERHAMILAALWQSRDHENSLVSKDGIVEICNTFLSKYDRPKIGREEFTLLTNDLDKIGAIELTRDGDIWLKDSVVVSYD
jgi:hypothetical protein